MYEVPPVPAGIWQSHCQDAALWIKIFPSENIISNVQILL
jgi:hypothetical protein